jgi:5-methylcytosine-specific restriction endonuclease McrA
MKYTDQQLELILQKTNGVCRICRGTEGPKLTLSNYGNAEVPEGWEVEHLNTRDLKGEDNPNSLWPVHIKCNSQKGMKKTKKVRKLSPPSTGTGHELGANGSGDKRSRRLISNFDSYRLTSHQP